MSDKIVKSLKNDTEFEFQFLDREWNANDFLVMLCNKNKESPIEGFEAIADAISKKDNKKLGNIISQVIDKYSIHVYGKHISYIYDELNRIYDSVGVPSTTATFNNMIHSLLRKISKDSDKYIYRVVSYYDSRHDDEEFIKKMFEKYSSRISRENHKKNSKDTHRNDKKDSNKIDYRKDISDIKDRLLLEFLKSKTDEKHEDKSRDKSRDDKRRDDKRRDNKRRDNKRNDKKKEAISIDLIESMTQEIPNIESHLEEEEEIKKEVREDSRADFDKTSEEDIKKKLLLDKILDCPQIIEQLAFFDDFKKTIIEVSNEYINQYIEFTRYNSKIKSSDIQLAIITLNNHMNESIDYSVFSIAESIAYYEISKFISNLITK